MNFNLYLFGKNKGAYNQYPDDYTSSFLNGVCSDINGSCGIVYRDHNLMHYIYAENFGDGNILGVCLIFNKAYLKRATKLFGFFRELFETTLLKQGRIIRYNSEGKVEFKEPLIKDNIKSYEYIKSLIDTKLDSHENPFKVVELTSVYNGVKNSETVEVEINDYVLNKLCDTYNRIKIDYKQGIENDEFNKLILQYQETIKAGNETIDFQKEQIKRLEKARKQYRYVMFLCIVLIASLVGIYLLYEYQKKTERDLLDRTTELNTANSTIRDQNETIDRNNIKISGLQKDLREEEAKREVAEKTLAIIQGSCPFLITSSSSNLSERTYTVNYIWLPEESETVTVKIKVYNERTGSLYTQKAIVEDVSHGSGTFTLSFGTNFNTKDWYTFEVWIGDKLVGGSRH